MEKTQRASIEQTQFFQAALELCEAKGYHAIRDEEIAEWAGYSIEVFDQYFKGKRDLFLTLFEQLLNDLQEKITQTLMHSSSATEALRRLFQTLPDWSANHPGLARAADEFFWLAAQDLGVRLVLMSYYDILVKEAAQIIKWGITYGEFDPAVDPQQSAWLLFTAVDGIRLLHSILQQEGMGIQAKGNLLEVLLSALRHKKSIEQNDEKNAYSVVADDCSAIPIANR